MTDEKLYRVFTAGSIFDLAVGLGFRGCATRLGGYLGGMVDRDCFETFRRGYVAFLASLLAPLLLAAAVPAREASSSPTEATRVLVAWNEALDARDANRLEGLYDTKVLFYGKTKTSAQVIESKRVALARNPRFRQSVDNVRIEPTDEGARILFRKRSGTELRSTIQARLTLVAKGGNWTIAEETDAATDALFRRSNSETCEDAALAAAEGNPAIARDRARVAKASPGIRPSSITEEGTAHSLYANLGYMHPERFEGRWTVTVENGELQIVENGTEKPLQVPEIERAKVRRICQDAPGAATGRR